MKKSLIYRIQKFPIIYVWTIIIGLFVLVAGLMSSRFFADISQEDETERVSKQALLIASVVQAEDIAQFKADYSDTLNPEYIRLEKNFTSFCNRMPDIRYIYLFGQRNDHVFFYLDTESDRNKPKALRETASPGELYIDAPMEFDTVFKRKQMMVLNPYTDQRGSFVTVLIPIFNQNKKMVAAVGVDVETQLWNKTLHSKMMFPIVVSIVFIILIVLASIFLRYRIELQTHTLEMYTLFDSALTSSDQATILFSLDYQILYFNKKAINFTQIFLNSSLKVGKDLSGMIIDEPNRARFIENTQTLHSKNNLTSEINYKDRVYSIHYKFIQHSETEAPFICLTIHDITEQIEDSDQNAILRAEQKYSSQQFKYATLLVDHQLNIIQANSWFNHQIGFSNSATIDKNLDVLLESDSYAEIKREIENFHNNTPSPFEIVLHFKSNYISDGVSSKVKVIPVISPRQTKFLFICTDSSIIDDSRIKEKTELDSALTIIDNLPGFVYRCKNDSFWTVLYLGKGFQEITGYAIDEVLFNSNRTYNDLISPEYREAINAKWQQCFQTHSLFEEKYEIITAKGERLWVFERGFALFDEDGNIAEIQGFITEITNLMNSCNSIERESKSLKSYIDYAPHGLMQIDADMNIIRANCSILDLIEYDLEFIRSQKVSLFVHPDSFNSYTKFVKKLIDEGSSSEELMLLTKSKAIKHIKLSAIRFNENDYILYFVDQTQCHESYKLLDDHNRFLQSIINLIPVPFGIINRTTNAITFSNLLLSELLDSDLEQLIGLRSAPDGSTTMSLMQKVSSSLKTEIIEFEKHTAHSKDDYYLINAMPFGKKGSEMEGIIIFLFDITKLKSRDRNLQMMLQKSESAMALKNEFFANISQEIRTPLNNIIGISELLINSSSNEQQTQYLNLVKDTSLNLINLVNSILDYSKIEAGKINLVFESFYPENLLNSLSILYTQICEEKGIEFNLSIDHSAFVQLISDEIRIRQLLVNLVGNAIRNTDVGHVSVSLSTYSEASETWLKISVSDTGIGIPSDKLDYIFDDYYQIETESFNRKPGSGLGLSICKRIVELLKGTITVDSQLGIGSVFNIEIPVEFANSDINELLNDRFDELNILLVVSNEIERKSLRQTFLDFNATVVVCKNGIEALQIVVDWSSQGKIFDYVFIDYLIDGITCLDVIKTVELKMKDTSVVILSKQLDFENALKIKSLPLVDHVFSKPILPSMLRNVLLSKQDPKLNKPHPLGLASSNITILVVEDNSVNMLVLKEILLFSGAHVVEAYDGQQAYVQFLSHQPQIIFLDIHMPVMDGFEVTKLIRDYGDENPEFVKPYIVALTAELFFNKKEDYLAAGMNDYISKPYKIEDIRECLTHFSEL